VQGKTGDDGDYEVELWSFLDLIVGAGTWMRTEVVLVRHATSVLPAADGPDELRRPLAADGLRDALELAGSLAALRPSAVWSSPYLRAVQTVEPTARALGLEVQTRWELREWDHGPAVTPDWMAHYEHSWADPSYARGDGESLDQLTRRAVDIVRTLVAQHAGQLVLVGSHGTFVARALCGFGLAVDWPFARNMAMPAVYHLRFDQQRELPDVTGPGLPIDSACTAET
jgi:2,3-bisphosphoglycerate-dependent phosphoglycerate mutase